MNKITESIGRDIYFSPGLDLDEVDRTLKEKFGIQIFWLFEDGIKFSYPDNFITKDYPGDISFYDAERGDLVITVLENFGALEFLSKNEEVIYSIPIIE